MIFPFLIPFVLCSVDQGPQEYPYVIEIMAFWLHVQNYKKREQTQKSG